MKSINNSRYWSLVFLLVLSSEACLAQSQSVLSLDSCLILAERNYPQIAQFDLINQSTDYTLSNAQKGKLPQLSIKGQASYQSDVTSLPGGAGMGVSELSKDQYQLYGEVVQPLTALAIIKQQQKIIKAEGAISKADLKAKVYAIKLRVSDLFFGVLLIQEQLKQSELTTKDLRTGLSKVDASVKYGTALKSSSDVLKAQLLNVEQRIIEQKATREGYLKMLGLFIGRDLDENTLLTSSPLIDLEQQINRPELILFDSQLQAITLQSGLLSKTNLPQFSLFLKGGFGRPALNFLSNDFEPFYIGGLRFSWNISNFYTAQGKKQLFSINRDIIQAERETFLFNTHLLLSNQNVQIKKAEALIEKDNEIIALRDRIVTTAKGQLENGVITPSEYTTVINDADAARQSLMLHRVELLKLKNDYKLTSGN